MGKTRFDFSGQAAIVTGSAKGIGQACVPQKLHLRSGRKRYNPIIVVEAIQDRSGYHLFTFSQAMAIFSYTSGSATNWLMYPGPQRQVWSTLIVIVHLLLKDSSQVILRKRDHVIQTLPPHRSDGPFTDRICLWTPVWCPEHTKPHVFDRTIQIL